MSKAFEKFDLVVLGSGEGGKYLAWTLAKQGKKVAVVERQWVGGSCPNIACLPSKNMIHSAKIASFFYRSEEFGITKDNVHIDMGRVRERKRKMVRALVEVHHEQYKKSGAQLIMGSGRFVAAKTIEVALVDGGTRTLRGENVVINTGTRALRADIPGLEAVGALTHIEALELDQVPSHLIVLGGGFIGLEFAQMMRRLGSEVTVVDRNSRLAHREDPDVSEGLHHLCRDEGIAVATGVQVSRVSGKSGESVRLEGTSHGEAFAVEGSHLLLASGRTPNTRGIGLEEVGVELTEQGHVRVNDRLQASLPGVWAIGDCAGSPNYTHISFDDFRVIRDNLAGVAHSTTGRQVPFCLFTDPELARIGLSEAEAHAQGIPFRLAKIPMLANLRTRTLSETRGFMKVLVATDSDRIIGFTMFGVMAGEVMSTVQVAMIGGLPYTTLRDAIFTHPTMLEGLITLFSAVPPRSA